MRFVMHSCRVLNFGTTALAILLLFAQASNGTVCVGHKLPSLRNIFGVVVDASGVPIPNAKVKIVTGGKEVLATATGSNGKFGFQHIDAGKYEIEFEAANFETVSYAIVVAKPDASLKKMLKVQLALGNECPDIQILAK